MKSDSGLVILVTGASSGIGHSLAESLSQNGHRVYGTSRRKPDHDQSNFEWLEMDVRNDESVKHGVDFILSRESRLDVVINNAGYGLAGSVEDTSIIEAKAQFETNFFGVVRVCRAVLPTMRIQKQGFIVNISSIAGRISVPFQSFYCASKFAVEGFTEALRAEVRQYGICVTLIEPGDYRTNFTANRQIAALADTNSPYYEQFYKTLSIMVSTETNGPSPERIAVMLDRILRNPSPRLRYISGITLQRFTVAAKKVVPDRVLEWILSKYFKLR